MCEPAWKGALLGSSTLFGKLLTLPILPPLADKYGRRRFWVAGRILECILYSVLMFTRSWTVMLCVMTGFGMMSTTRLTIGITYLQELFPKSHQTYILVTMFVECALIYVACTLYFWIISKDWFSFVLIGYILCILTTLVTFLVPESPRLLFSLGHIEQGKATLDRIAWYNCMKPLDWEDSGNVACIDEIKAHLAKMNTSGSKVAYFRHMDALPGVYTQAKNDEVGYVI